MGQKGGGERGRALSLALPALSFSLSLPPLPKTPGATNPTTQSIHSTATVLLVGDYGGAGGRDGRAQRHNTAYQAIKNLENDSVLLM